MQRSLPDLGKASRFYFSAAFSEKKVIVFLGRLFSGEINVCQARREQGIPAWSSGRRVKRGKPAFHFCALKY